MSSLRPANDQRGNFLDNRWKWGRRFSRHTETDDWQERLSHMRRCCQETAFPRRALRTPPLRYPEKEVLNSQEFPHQSPRAALLQFRVYPRMILISNELCGQKYAARPSPKANSFPASERAAPPKMPVQDAPVFHGTSISYQR